MKLLLRSSIYFFFFALSVRLVQAFAEPGLQNTQYAKTPAWIDVPRAYIGRKVHNMSTAIDGFLSQEKSRAENESYMKLRMGFIQEEGGTHYTKNDIRLRVDLPRTKDKWQLIFETDPDELETLEEQTQDRKTDENKLRDTDGSIGALRFVLNDWRYWKSDFDVGVKAPLPLNSFVRFNMRRDYRVTENWRAKMRHSVYFFHDEGFGERSSLVVSRPVFSGFFYTNSSVMQWARRGQELEFANVSSLNYRPSDHENVTWRLGAYWEGHPDARLKSYFFDVKYRRRLHKDWLYGEVIPDITWSENRDFYGFASITFRVEVYFRP